MAERWCRVCSRPFRPRSSSHVFCSELCRAKAKTLARLLKPARYGAVHQRARSEVGKLVRAGGVRCARCGLPLRPDEDFDLDHRDDGNGYLGASHVDCNRSAPHRRRSSPAVPASVPADDPSRGLYYGPQAEKWSRAGFEWR